MFAWNRVFHRVLGMMAAMVMAATAHAGEITDLAAKAEQLLAAKKPVAAYKTLDQAMAKLWARMPFSVTHALFTKGRSQGYGIYTPRGNSAFKPGEPLYVYAELAGFGHRSRNGAYEIAIDGDVAIVNAQKQVLAKQENFLRSRQVSRHRNREFFVQIKLELGGAPEGRYVLLGRLKDRTTGQEATLTLPFEIRR